MIICFRETLFENRTAGVSPDSTKVLVLITDGDPSDPDNNIISKYDEKHIIRFVIGVSLKVLTLLLQVLKSVVSITVLGVVHLSIWSTKVNISCVSGQTR